jgi:hypothetical protein
MLLCASEGVIQAMADVWGAGLYVETLEEEEERSGSDAEEEGPDFATSVLNLFFAMRHDLGHSNHGLTSIDLVTFFAAESLLEAQPHAAERR